jgi:GNAT superfamily N-acetyltransferase
MEGLGPVYYDDDQTRHAAIYLTNPDLDLIQDGTFYVVEESGILVGCGGWSRRRKLFTGSTAQEALSAEYLEPSTEPAKIRAFFISPDFARKGIGRMIYEQCESAALGYGFAALELMSTLPGVSFYDRLGFVRVEEVDIDLPSGDQLPGVRMRKEI